MDTDVFHDVLADDPEWNESFYFNCYDKGNDICIFMRIGNKQNKDEKSMFCFIMLPDGSFMGLKGEEALDSKMLSVLGLSYKKIEAEKEWKLCYQGTMEHISKNGPLQANVQFDLTFYALNKIFDYRKCVTDSFKEKISQQVASEHLEQYGKITGKLSINNKQIQITGLGERDHSWGVRDWTFPNMWVWLTSGFSEKLALNVTKLYVDQGEVDAGFFYEKGKNDPLKAIDISIDYDDEKSPKSFSMTLRDEDEKIYYVTAKILRQVALPFVSNDGGKISIMYETLAEYIYDGEKGYGIAEFLIKK